MDKHCHQYYRNGFSIAMMTTFRIELDTADARFGERVHSSRPLILPIHIRVGDAHFPDALWDDFVVVILGWWLEEVGALERHDTETAFLRFMDGPYEVKIASLAPDVWSLTGMERGLHVQQQWQVSVLAADVVAELRRAAFQLLSAVDSANAWDRDSKKLQEMFVAGNANGGTKGTS